MRSLIIIDVEHGEDTDPLEELLGVVLVEAAIMNLPVDYTVRVDLPACFHMNPLDALIPKFEGN